MRLSGVIVPRVRISSMFALIKPWQNTVFNTTVIIDAREIPSPVRRAAGSVLAAVGVAWRGVACTAPCTCRACTAPRRTSEGTIVRCRL